MSNGPVDGYLFHSSCINDLLKLRNIIKDHPGKSMKQLRRLTYRCLSSSYEMEKGLKEVNVECDVLN